MSPTDRSRRPVEDGSTTQFATASGVAVPPLTVWLGSAMYTFPVDRDVIVGRDRDCDIRFQDIDPDDLTLISRIHAILRFDDGQWVVVDKSQNGIYVAGSRADLVPIRDRLSVALGSPRGPQLTFRVATSSPTRPRNPQTVEHRTDEPLGDSPNTAMFRPTGPQRPARAPWRPPSRPMASQPQPSRPARPVSETRRTAGSAASATIGRAKTNNVVVEDALASRVHAVL